MATQSRPVIPVQGVSTSDLTDTFGADRSGGRSHKGIDIFADRGTPALATVGGEVTAAAPSGKGGKRVWVRGDDGQAHYYAHLSSIDVQPGQRVSAGDPIGAVGKTGNAQNTPPHLHYSINDEQGPEDGRINPFNYLQGGIASQEGQPGTGSQQGVSSMDFEVPDYPSTPAPLPASSVRDYAERRRQASRNLESALAKRERGEALQGQKLERTKERLEREAEEAEDAQRAELSAAGMARQPRGIGRALRDIQTDRSEALSDAQFGKSQKLAALDFAVNQARNERDRVRSNIRADKATERTRLDKLIGGSG